MVEISDLEQQYGIPSGLYAGIIGRGERSGATATSPKGAYGQAQLMPATAAEMGVDPRDPTQNLIGGAKYLKLLLTRYGGDKTKAVEAYNEGMGRVDRGVVYPETAAYVRRVIGANVMPNAGSDMGGSAVLQQLLGGASDDPLVKQAMAAQGRLSEDNQATKAALDQQSKDLQGVRSKYAAITSPNAPATPQLPGEQGYNDRELAKVSDKPMDPTRAMGQFLPMLAILGGAFTKNGAIASLKAAGAAMSAAKQNDTDALARAHQQWMDDTGQLVKQYGMEQDAFHSALEKNGENRANLQADLSVLAAQYNIPILKAQVDQGDLDGAFKTIQARNTSLQPIMEMHRQAVDDDFKRQELSIKQQEIPPADLAFRSASDAWLQAHPGDQEGALKAGGAAVQEVRAGSLQSEHSDENKIRTELMKPGSPAAAYQAAKINETKINDAAEHPENYLTPSGSAIVADTFTQAFNGGKAIRGFQAKMLTDDRSLQNELMGAMQKAQTGGKFTPQEIKQMAEAVRRVQPELKADFERQAQDAIALARERGEDPHAVIPFGLSEDTDFGEDGSPTSQSGAMNLHPIPPEALQAYQGGTAEQKSAAKAAWQAQGFDVGGLN